MAYSECHDLVAAGDTIGNLFSWKVGEVAAANTEDGDTPPHHALGPPFRTKRCPQQFLHVREGRGTRNFVRKLMAVQSRPACSCIDGIVQEKAHTLRCLLLCAAVVAARAVGSVNLVCTCPLSAFRYLPSNPVWATRIPFVVYFS